MIRHCIAATLAAAAIVHGLAGCATAPTVETVNEPARTEAGYDPEELLVIRGAVTYRARIALPPEAELVLEVRKTSVVGAPVVIEMRSPTNGKQVPIAFEFPVRRFAVSPDHTYDFRGGILVGGEAQWITPPLPISPTAETIELGELEMQPADGEVFGKKETDEPIFRGRGNEPFWSVTVTAEAIVVDLDMGQQQITVPNPAGQTVGAATRYLADDGLHRVLVMITDEVCVDSMSGMNYPQSVVVEVDGRELRGCGGDPAALLTGEAWLVTALDGTPTLPGTAVTLNFGADGVVFGDASCNTYRGPFVLSGEGLQFGNLASTMRACIGDALNQQEQRFFTLLHGVSRFVLTPEDELILYTNDNRTITARRG